MKFNGVFGFTIANQLLGVGRLSRTVNQNESTKQKANEKKKKQNCEKKIRMRKKPTQRLLCLLNTTERKIKEKKKHAKIKRNTLE